MSFGFCHSLVLTLSSIVVLLLSIYQQLVKDISQQKISKLYEGPKRDYKVLLFKLSNIIFQIHSFDIFCCVQICDLCNFFSNRVEVENVCRQVVSTEQKFQYLDDR